MKSLVEGVGYARQMRKNPGFTAVRPRSGDHQEKADDRFRLLWRLNLDAITFVVRCGCISACSCCVSSIHEGFGQ